MTIDSAPLILSYAAESSPKTRWHSWLLVLLSLPALAIPFLDFVHGVSPLSAVQDISLTRSHFIDDWLLGLLGSGFFIAWIAVLWNALTLLTRPLARTRQLFWLLAALACLPCGLLSAMVVMEIPDAAQNEHLSQLWPFALNAGLVILGIITAWQLKRRTRPTEAISALFFTAFIAHALLCLIGFNSDSPDPGYWLSLAVVILWSTQSLQLFWLAWRPRSYDDLPTSGDVA